MKPANLTSGLLTRKGQAQPTLISPPRSADISVHSPPVASLPLLRAKDCSAAPASEAWPEKSTSGLLAAAARTALDRRVHMSLRLDPGRHLRLRIEAARTGRSMQSLMIEALDTFLSDENTDTGIKPPTHPNSTGDADGGNRRGPRQPIGAETSGGPPRSR